MSLLPSIATRITVEATRYRSAVSEFLVQTLGQSINFLLDDNDAIQAALAATQISQVSFAQLTGATIYTVPVNTTAMVFMIAKSGESAGNLTVNGSGGGIIVQKNHDTYNDMEIRVYPAGTTLQNFQYGFSDLYWILSTDNNIVIP